MYMHAHVEQAQRHARLLVLLHEGILDHFLLPWLKVIDDIHPAWPLFLDSFCCTKWLLPVWVFRLPYWPYLGTHELLMKINAKENFLGFELKLSQQFPLVA